MTGEQIKPNFRWRRKPRFQPVPYFIEPSKLHLDGNAPSDSKLPAAKTNVPSAATFVAVEEKLPQTERYRRSHHIELELELIAILNRDRELGSNQPHREIVTPCLKLLRKVAHHADPFKRILHHLADQFDQAIFDRQSRLLFYELMAIRAADAAERDSVIRQLTCQLDDLRALHQVQQEQMASIQDRLADANVRVRERDIQLRSQADSISKLKALLESASESVQGLQAELSKTAGTHIMNNSLQRELDDLRVRYAQQKQESVESLELLNAAMEAKIALQKQLEEMNSVHQV